MIKKTINSLNFYFFESLSKHKELFHFVTTKPLNLSFVADGNSKEKVLPNRKKIANVLGLDLNDFVFMRQVHSKNIKIITEKEKGRGVFDYQSGIDSTDAMITNIPGICLSIMTADCVPILTFDPKQKVIAAVHAGRKGTELQIVKETVKILREKFSCQPKDLIAGLGPAIGPCHYEVDLRRENQKQLIESGVLESNIEISGLCTFCHSDEFFSARAEKLKNHTLGHFVAGIMLT